MTEADFQAAFHDCSDIRVLRIHSGQKDVAIGKWKGRDVALKAFKKVGGDEDKRIERELAAVQKLKSSYVPEVFESGKKIIAGEERHYLIEQYIDGQSYADLLATRGPQDAASLVSLLGALITACADFSSVGITHRDLKPGNLMIDHAGKLWVIDFGFCRHSDLSRVTPSGAGVGTPGYSPLEQLRLLPAEINVRADLFSSGVIAYEAANGGAPTAWRDGAGDVFEIVQRMKAQELPPLAIAGDTKGKLAEFIGWLVKRLPSQRPQTAQDALEALKDVAGSIQ